MFAVHQRILNLKNFCLPSAPHTQIYLSKYWCHANWAKMPINQSLFSVRSQCCTLLECYTKQVPSAGSSKRDYILHWHSIDGIFKNICRFFRYINVLFHGTIALLYAFVKYNLLKIHRRNSRSTLNIGDVADNVKNN